MIPVTKPFFPRIEEYQFFLKRIWKNQWLTNRGELVRELESKIKEKLSVNDFLLTNNGTIPLQIALKVLARKGEVITTPFSYVATTSSIVWQDCTPVFVDIDPNYWTIDETKIEEAITSRTTCILATHVFGNPCNVLEIERIATKHGIAVIYDAAHAFGVRYNGQSLFSYGDVSTCSFHATKLFHTGEGGGLFTNRADLVNEMFYSHNFGHNGPTDFFGVGINGKMSELQAAMGLAVLPYTDELIEIRTKIHESYDKALDTCDFQKIKVREGTDWNYSYYPVLMSSESALMKAIKLLNTNDIFPRRYFYPSLNTLNYVSSEKMNVSEDISSRVLCLPLYPSLKAKEVDLICELLNKSV